MISIPAVIKLQEKDIVPIRAIPFVTGQLTRLDVATLLANTEIQLIAYVVGSNGESAAMRPNEWGRVVAALNSLAVLRNQTSDHEQLELLPPSTFVHWERLWRTYENHYLPDRQLLNEENYTPAELANFELHRNVSMRKELVDLVFEGFNSAPIVTSISVAAVTSATAPNVPKPVQRSFAQDAAILAALKKLGYMPASLPKRQPGKPWVKSAVKSALGNKGIWAPTTVFDKAWDRLRTSGAIAEQ